MCPISISACPILLNNLFVFVTFALRFNLTCTFVCVHVSCAVYMYVSNQHFCMSYIYYCVRNMYSRPIYHHLYTCTRYPLALGMANLPVVKQMFVLVRVSLQIAGKANVCVSQSKLANSW